MSALLEVRDLYLEFKTARGRLQALNGTSFDVQPGEVFGLVGETGCGKTVTGLSILRLLPRSAAITHGQVRLGEVDLLSLSPGQIEAVRGRQIAMIFQDPSTSLNPVFTIGAQIRRVIRQHLAISRQEEIDQTRKVLAGVGLPDVDRIMGSYPHQLSGGMQQRVMIAMALSCNPKLLIADEPTTALDVTIQAQILKLLRDLQKTFGVSVILITHNLGVIAQTCDRLAVLYGGRVVESGPTEDIFTAPCHPYTIGLMNAIPHPGDRGVRMAAIGGTVPSNPGAMRGCAFAPRCASAFGRCMEEMPAAYPVSPSHACACFLAEKCP